ncbi:MAG: FAD-dependent oxidoreductase [Clostridia bacterium]|nr:FAD-dependent oxidoreductase [Clostridia bacterium]
MKRYDLVVVGGGFAGVASAISASRQGVSVLLIEKSNCLGGASTNSLVNPFMPTVTHIERERVELNRGIFEEIKNELKKRNAMLWDGFLEEELKLILNRMVLSSGVDILFHAQLTEVKAINDKIFSISLATIGGIEEIEADYFIDATGDAQLSYLSGVPCMQGRRTDGLCQPMTLCFRVGNVDFDKFSKSASKMQEEYKIAKEKSEIKNPRENILYFQLPQKNVVHFNTTRIVKKSPTCVYDLTKAEIEAREQVFEIYEFMKKHAQGLEDSFILSTASQIGVRESRQIIGKYTLTEADCLECRKFEDSVVACNYDIDIHNPEGTGTSHHYFKDGEYYTIPYRCLVPSKIDNLLVAGRCISSTHEAQASYRIMPVVCNLGQVAGVAMAQAIKEKIKPSDIDISKLQAQLKLDNLFIGI